MSDFLKKKGVQYFIIGLIICGVLLVIFNPSVGLVQQGADFAVHFTLAYLIGGIFFLVLNQKNLMLASFIACGVLCLFLKSSSNSSFLLPEINRGSSLRIAHIDVSAASGSQDVFMNTILQLDADVISFQEVDPSWPVIFSYYLDSKYPYKHENIRIDPFGMAVYSKTNFLRKDTLFIEDYPTLISTLFVDNQKSMTIMSSYTMPGLDSQFRSTNRRFFSGLAQEVLKSTTPNLILGKFNMPYWNNDLITFARQAALEHSRRDAVAAGLNTPYDHIYYTEQLECTKFDEILDSQRNHLGIIGNYQFKNTENAPSSKEIPTVNRF